MPDWTITIAKEASGKISFKPSPRNVLPGDNVIWRNDDEQPHWPGMTDNQKYFMEYQIAPGGSSTAFSFRNVGRVEYVDTLSDATGIIEVLAEPPSR